jgi:hypothetical protein
MSENVTPFEAVISSTTYERVKKERGGKKDISSTTYKELENGILWSTRILYCL